MNVQQKQPTVMTSREFNQNTARAKREARKGPVVITERGQPALVLLSVEEFQRLGSSRQESASGKPRSLADALADDRPEADFEFEPPRLSDDWGLQIPRFD